MGVNSILKCKVTTLSTNLKVNISCTIHIEINKKKKCDLMYKEFGGANYQSCLLPVWKTHNIK